MRISACIITLNEETNLRRCLESCTGLAEEVVVLDSGSTDGTEAVAREYGVRWVVREWPGYMRQKNNVIGLANEEWVLSLDADEALSPGLCRALEELKKTKPPDSVAGFSMSRCVF